MTTILFQGTGDYVKIFSVKVDEQIDKSPVSWADLVPKAQWGTKPAKRYVMDFKNVTNAFVITGTICADSLGVTGSVLDARDLLKSFIVGGGTVNMKYGLAAELAGLDPSYSATSNSYYGSAGFEVIITRLQFSEDPKGGDSGANISSSTAEAIKGVPELFNVTLTCQCGVDYSS